MSVIEIGTLNSELGRTNVIVTPTPFGSPEGRTLMSAVEPTCVPLLFTARPARSPAAGGGTRSNVTGVVTGTVPNAFAVTVPLPTWHAVSVRSAFVRHAPPSIEASASSPGGRLSVMASGESPLVGANVRSSPRFVTEPAAVPAL